MQRKIIIVLLVWLLCSCMTARRATYYNETVEFYRDLLSEDKSFCSKKIKNDYWIKELADMRLDAMRKYLDSVGTKTSDDYLEFEVRYNFMTLESVSIPDAITVDYDKVITDLRLTNNMRFSRFADCDSAATGHISFPIFNKEHSKAVIETEGGTFLFEKVSGRWAFKDRGLLRVF